MVTVKRAEILELFSGRLDCRPFSTNINYLSERDTHALMPLSVPLNIADAMTVRGCSLYLYMLETEALSDMYSQLLP
jgi:hypothetical protein